MHCPNRRRVLRLGGVATAGVLSGCLRLGSGSGGSRNHPPPWPGDGGGPERRWARPDATAVTDPVSTAWSTDLSGRVSLHAVVDGTVYVTSSDRVLALDRSDGTQRWSYTINAWGVWVAGGSVYVSDFDRLQVLDASDGSEAWSAEIAGSGVLGGPVVDDDAVYVMRSSLHVFDAETGEQRREQDTINDWTDSLTVTERGVYFRQAHSRISCLDRDGPGRRWARSLPLRTVRQPRAGDGSLYVGGRAEDGPEESAALFALDPDSGEQQWRYDGDGAFQVLTSPAIGTDTVYAGFQNGDDEADGGGLVAIDSASGDERWRRTYDRGVLSPCLVGDTVYTAPESQVIGHAASDGSRRMDRSFVDDVVGRPIVVGEHLYVVVDDTLYAIEQG